jgi:hypothetical protein
VSSEIVSELTLFPPLPEGAGAEEEEAPVAEVDWSAIFGFCFRRLSSRLEIKYRRGEAVVYILSGKDIGYVNQR